ncbi:conserved protein, unknown function [Hepatocystis sp. ex Piliocolobus tephrosceles]|nr:conserved protein, unknown function [Hepatocystis sp. ex Piliocolobus tephrosceles]
MSEQDLEPIGVNTKIKELEKLFNASLQTKENNIKTSDYLKLYEEQKIVITDLLNTEQNKALKDIEDMKNNILKKINIISNKNEDIKKQSDILIEEKDKNLTCIKNIEMKIESVKKVLT